MSSLEFKFKVSAVAEKTKKLTEHGKEYRWNPATDVDWNAGGDFFEKLSQKEKMALRSVLSLVYHSDAQGEQILTKMCKIIDAKKSKFLASHPELADSVKEFFVQQIEDEDRHAEGIRMLFDKLGLTPEPQAFSHRFYSKFLVAENLFDAKLILVYWYIEVVAKNIFVELKLRFPGTNIDSLFTRIVRDEARHAGFGEVYIPLHIEQASIASYASMKFAHLTSYAAIPLLFKFDYYANAARILSLSLPRLFSSSIIEMATRAKKLPENRSMPFFEKSSEKIANWIA